MSKTFSSNIRTSRKHRLKNERTGTYSSRISGPFEAMVLKYLDSRREFSGLADIEGEWMSCADVSLMHDLGLKQYGALNKYVSIQKGEHLGSQKHTIVVVVARLDDVEGRLRSWVRC
jgi:hypothetical protein